MSRQIVFLVSGVVLLTSVVAVIDILGGGSRGDADQVMSQLADDVTDRQDEQNVRFLEALELAFDSDHLGLFRGTESFGEKF